MLGDAFMGWKATRVEEVVVREGGVGLFDGDVPCVAVGLRAGVFWLGADLSGVRGFMYRS